MTTQTNPITAPFTHHPASVGESYGQHFIHAGGFGLSMIGGGLACLVHAILPFLCEKTGSQIIRRLHDRMIINRTGHGVEIEPGLFQGAHI
jgi:hypothetical protein